MDTRPSIAFPPHPALAWRAFRFHKAWRRGPGRYAGILVAPLLVVLMIVVLGAHVIEESVCLSDRGVKMDDCTRVAAWINYGIWDSIILFTAFCLSTSLAAIHARRRLRSHQRTLQARRDRLGPAVLSHPLAQTDLAALHEHQLALADSDQDEPRLLSAANTYLGLGLTAFTIALIHLQEAVFLVEDNDAVVGPARALFYAAPVLALAYYALRPSVRMHRAATDLRRERAAKIGAALESLQRRRDGTHTPEASFRPYGAPRGSPKG